MVDLSDPTNPTVATYYNTWDGRLGNSFYEGVVGVDVDLSAGLIYLADIPRGLIILHE